jgi:hypothetical protein
MNNTDSVEASPTPPTLLTIPLELRLQIYDNCLRWTSSQEILYELNRYSPAGSQSLKILLLTCRQIHDETLPLRTKMQHYMLMSMVRYAEAGYNNIAREFPPPEAKFSHHGAFYPLSSVRRFGLVVSLEDVARVSYRRLYLPRFSGAFTDFEFQQLHSEELYVVMCTCSWYEQGHTSRPRLRRTALKRDYGVVAEQYMIGLKHHLLEHRSIQTLALVYCGAKDCFANENTTSGVQFIEPAEALVRGVAALPDHRWDTRPKPSFEAGSVQFSVSGSFGKQDISEPQFGEKSKPWEKWLNIYQGQIMMNYKQDSSERKVSFEIYSYRGPQPASCLCLMEVGYRPERAWPTPGLREVFEM